jgi:hypothetical protein
LVSSGQRGSNHGEGIESNPRQRQARNAQAQGRDAQERTERKDGQEQEAGSAFRKLGPRAKGSGEEGILSRHSANSYSTAASCSLGRQLSRAHAAIVGRISEIAPLAQSVDARNRDYGDSASYRARIGGRATPTKSFTPANSQPGQSPRVRARPRVGPQPHGRRPRPRRGEGRRKR